MRPPLVSRGTKLLLFFLLWPTYGYFYQSASHNEAARLDQARALAVDGSLWVDRYAYNSADLIWFERQGERHYYSGKAPGTTLLIALPLKFFDWALALANQTEAIHWHLVTYLTTVTTVSLLSALASVAMLEAVVILTASVPLAILGIISIWLGSICFPFSTLLFGHQIAASFLALSFWLLVRYRWLRPAGRNEARVSLLAAGLFAGWAVITEYPTVILAALLTCYLIATLWSRARSLSSKMASLGLFSAGAGAAAALLIGYNALLFDRILYVPYQAYLEGLEPAAFPAHAQGFLGIHFPGWANLFDVLAEITIRPQRGLLYLGFDSEGLYSLSPVLWLALAGIVVLMVRHQTRFEGLLIAAAAASFLLFNASYGDSIIYWGGGASVGPRHLVPLLPFLAAPIAITVRRLWWVFLPLLGISIFYVLLATATEPRPGYEFDNPSRDLFLHSYLDGRLSLGRDPGFDSTGQLLTDDSVAFNLGKLLDLPGSWQLAPLMIWWLVIGTLLARSSTKVPATQDRRTPGSIAAIRPPSTFLRLLGPLTIAVFGVVVVGLPMLSLSVGATDDPGKGLRGSYFNNSDWSGQPQKVQIDPRVDFDWREPPWPLPPPFSIEWSGWITIDRPGTYLFSLESDDGSMLEIDGRLVVDNGGIHDLREQSGQISLEPGSFPLRLRYFNSLFGGSMTMRWTPPDGHSEIVPSRVLSPDRRVPEEL